MWPGLMALDLIIPRSLKPMEAEPVDELPTGKGWLYEPKYDGFRCLAFRDGDKIDLQSNNQKSLDRLFRRWLPVSAG
jgi:ATP-dependent DNA ligase